MITERRYIDWMHWWRRKERKNEKRGGSVNGKKDEEENVITLSHHWMHSHWHSLRVITSQEKGIQSFTSGVVNGDIALLEIVSEQFALYSFAGVSSYCIPSIYLSGYSFYVCIFVSHTNSSLSYTTRLFKMRKKETLYWRSAHTLKVTR